MKARLLAAIVLLAIPLGCGWVDDGTSAGEAGRTTSTTATSSTTTVPVLPAPERYVPLPGEPEPEAKRLAAEVVQTIGTYPIGAGDVSTASARVSTLIDPTRILAADALLVPDAASSVEIVYPQLGGLTAAKASVMVVFRQTLLRSEGEQRVVRTADVRLERTEGVWKVTSIESIGGEPPIEPLTASLAGRAVLDSAAIDLPDSARWDIEAGRVDDRVLRLLDELARAHTLSVTVLASGHPYNVFEASYVSNHTVGRGVDIWAVDGEPVVLQQQVGSPVYALVQELLDRGAVTELGSPWDLDGGGSAVSFTNTVHQDHLHLAFDG